jgi:copper(I)-binding protein
VIAACGPTAEPQVELPPPPPSSILSVTDAWARAADSGAMSSVYFTVENSGVVPDTLTAVRTEVSEQVGMHMSMEQNGTMTMAELRALPVPAQDSLLFRPLGAHVMLTRLSKPLVGGDTVQVTLAFVSGKSIEVRAVVRDP